MDKEIARRDTLAFLRALLSFGPVLLLGLAVSLFALLPQNIFANLPLQIGIAAALSILAASVAYRRSLKSRWINQRFYLLWMQCVDRRDRFHEAQRLLSKSRVAELSDLPQTVDRLASTVYVALRRADIVNHEIVRSEGAQALNPIVNSHRPTDTQVQELYQVADRNVAEYRRHLQGVMAGVSRSMAQAEVFLTTLDALRIRMLGYRLGSRTPELDSHEFLTVITEAKMQFEAIDKALEEIELTPFPERVAIMPDGQRIPLSDPAAHATPNTPVDRDILSNQSPPAVPKHVQDAIDERINNQNS